MSNVKRAIASWGSPLPEWVRLLADACDRTSQRDVATALGKSGGYISRVLRQDYAGSYQEAELLIRARFGVEQVICPLAAEIPLASCIRARRRTGPALNQLHRDWARACPTCPNNTDRKED